MLSLTLRKNIPSLAIMEIFNFCGLTYIYADLVFIIIINPYIPYWGTEPQQFPSSTEPCPSQLPEPLPMSDPSHLVQCQSSSSKWFWASFSICLQASTKGQPWLSSLASFVVHTASLNLEVDTSTSLLVEVVVGNFVKGTDFVYLPFYNSPTFRAIQ